MTAKDFIGNCAVRVTNIADHNMLVRIGLNICPYVKMSENVGYNPNGQWGYITAYQAMGYKIYEASDFLNHEEESTSKTSFRFKIGDKVIALQDGCINVGELNKFPCDRIMKKGETGIVYGTEEVHGDKHIAVRADSDGAAHQRARGKHRSFKNK